MGHREYSGYYVPKLLPRLRFVGRNFRSVRFLAKQTRRSPHWLPHNTNQTETMNTRMRKFSALLSLLAASSVITGAQTPTSAQPSPTNTSPTGTTVMEKFEVTGSYLPAAANSIAIPVIS